MTSHEIFFMELLALSGWLLNHSQKSKIKIIIDLLWLLTKLKVNLIIPSIRILLAYTSCATFGQNYPVFIGTYFHLARRKGTKNEYSPVLTRPAAGFWWATHFYTPLSPCHLSTCTDTSLGRVHTCWPIHKKKLMIFTHSSMLSRIL